VAQRHEVVDGDGVIQVVRPEHVPALERTPEQVSNLLQRPFPDHLIKTRPVGNGLVHYVAIGDVIDRLNRACATWNWTVTKIEVHMLPILRKGELVDTPVVHVTGVLQIPGLGTRGAVGTAPAENNEDPAKIAESDAIKRAATMFGVPGGR
jgi:hypothetical protein